jgi:hypothetical protein
VRTRGYPASLGEVVAFAMAEVLHHCHQDHANGKPLEHAMSVVRRHDVDQETLTRSIEDIALQPSASGVPTIVIITIIDV